MYLRETKRKNADGSCIAYYQIAENLWDKQKGCAVAKVIYNFGRADGVDADKLKRFAKSILRVFPEENNLALEHELDIVDTWHYGGIFALEQLWKELGIDTVLGRGSTDERALFAMVANRALQPYSKLYCHEQWLRKDVFFPEGQKLTLRQLYESMDFITLNQESIEKAIYFKMADLMNADVDLIFYDTTNIHFEIDEEDEAHITGPDGQKRSPLRKRGHAKNKRYDAPLVSIGLAVTRDGLPVRSWVFPGNTADVTTVERVKQDLKGWKLGQCIFVGDAGMNSLENRRTLSLANGKYILATKMRSGDDVTRKVIPNEDCYNMVRVNLYVKEVFVGEGENRQRYVVCYNPDEKERRRQHRQKLLEQLSEKLSMLKSPSPGKSHSKRSCQLLTSKRFGRYLCQNPDGTLCIDPKAVQSAESYDGKWVITTNDDTLSIEDLALGYKQLMRVEECWRAMKSGLRMRPVYHWLPHRIEAHVKICVLALLLERVAEIRCDETWRNLKSHLNTIKVVEYLRSGTRIRQTSELRPNVLELLHKLRCPHPPKLHYVSEAERPPSVTETS